MDKMMSGDHKTLSPQEIVSVIDVQWTQDIEKVQNQFSSQENKK